MDSWEVETHLTAWFKENRRTAGGFGMVCIGSDSVPVLGGEGNGADRGICLRDDGIASLMRAKKIKAITFLGNKRTQLADPGLLQPFIPKGGKGEPRLDQPEMNFKGNAREIEKIEDKENIINERLVLFDTLVLSRLYSELYPWSDLEKIVEGATGLELSKETFKSIATAIVRDARDFDQRENPS